LVKPYTQTYDKGVIIRQFEDDIESEELVWHRDRRTREVTVLDGDNWKIQLDNKLPEELVKGKIYKIPKMEYHRIIKGTGQLVVKIWEETDD
tara:strand:- start:117 stop:392 length:276 start_codon:yes stop_codon:yes gene_type:complete